MKITYIRLENVAGIMVGQGRDVIEISFEDSKNAIVAILARNAKGKSVLLSSLQPFSGVTSLDERSSLPYIIPGKNGYKEIHYINNDDEFIIKHYYKSTKDTHSVKSYFSMNGEELNENGNVTSFLALVELHLGLTPEVLRLNRLGTNVNSFVSLSPSRRKEYIGKLIEEINMYMKIYKKVSEDIKVAKALIASNTSSIQKCHVTDVLAEEKELKKLSKDIKSKEFERDIIVSKIFKIDSLMKENDIDELRRRRLEAESSLSDFSSIENKIHEMNLEHISLENLIVKRNNLSDEKLNTQSKINSYRLSVDSALKQIERIEVNIKRITSNNDIQSLMNAIRELKNRIDSTPEIVKSFKPTKSTSDDISYLLSKLSSFNQISKMIYSLGNKPIKIYLKLKRDGESVDKFLKEQQKRIMNNINNNDLKPLLNQVFGDDMFIFPNCDSQYVDCPYYRLSEVITQIKDKLDGETYDEETLRYVQVISNNIDTMLNEIDGMNKISIPDGIRSIMSEKSILNRLSSKIQLFDLSDLNEYLSIVKEYEIYLMNIDRLKQYENQLLLYKQSGVDNHMDEIKEIKNTIDFYKRNIIVLTNDMKKINETLSDIDYRIGLVTRYNDSKKYQKLYESTIEDTNRILQPLENASNEKIELEYNLRQINSRIESLRYDHKRRELMINEYNKLVVEGNRLKSMFDDLTIIRESVSTRKGIPVEYINRYLGKIKKLANELLDIIYENDLKLARFNITEDTFEIPYIRNGTKIPDVKYASQSELPLITIALSFALSNNASGAYNILLLDEVDSGLDEENRSAFLQMLYIQMRKLNVEQVFIISHNLTQMANVPMDVIKLSNLPTGRLQNVIYES